METFPGERKIRLFTALAVPDDFQSAFADLPRRGLEGRWSREDDLHITLRFLGDVPAEQLQTVCESLSRIKRAPFSIEVGGLGYFTLKKQTVLWAGVESTRKLTALAGDINESLAPLGFEMPRKPYVPHITLARLRSARGIENYAERHGKNIRIRWQADSFYLYRSGEPSETGSRYTILETYPLST